MSLSLIIPSFIAGVLTFLAPCTLPLVPAYLGFISGVSTHDLKDPEKLKAVRKKVFLNGLLYVIGFSGVFILLGVIFGLGGVALAGYQDVLSRVGGAFVILFALYMLGASNISFLSFLNFERHIKISGKLKPGKPSSSLILGATFAFGWTPCVGPILGSILLLATSTATITQGALLLAVFSLGLGLPFLIIALGIGHATQTIKKITKHLPKISLVGGVFLLFLGILLVTNMMEVWLQFAYKIFSFINYDALLNYL